MIEETWKEAVREVMMAAKALLAVYDDPPTRYVDIAASGEYALSIWDEEHDGDAMEIFALKQRIAQVESNILYRIGQRVAEKQQDDEWQRLADALIFQRVTPDEWAGW